MEKRILLAFLLSLVVLYGSRLLFPPKPASVVSEQTAAPTQTAAATAKPVATPEQSKPAAAQKTSEQVAPEMGDVQAETAEDVQVETSLYRSEERRVGK